MVDHLECSTGLDLVYRFGAAVLSPESIYGVILLETIVLKPYLLERRKYGL